MNIVILQGRVGNDPTIKTFDNGGKIASFIFATTEAYKDKNTGERKEIADWHNISVRSESLVNVVEKYVHKGDSLLLKGALKVRSYGEGKDKRYFTEVVVDSLTMLAKRNVSQDAPSHLDVNDCVNDADPMPF